MPRHTSFATLVAIATAAATLAAAPVTIKLATIAPANSVWHKALLDMGDAWSKATAGRVELRVYPGGTVGSEDTTVRKMRPGVGELQAGLLTLSGLAEIDDGFNIFGVPFFFQSDDEELAVQKAIAPALEKRLEAKGFRMLAWGSGGWVQVFSKKPLRTLSDVKAAKLYTSQGSPKMVQWYQANGFNPVALSDDQLVAQLKLPTGMIDAAPMPAYPAMLDNIFTSAKYMLDVRVDPLVGGIILSNDAWTKITADDQAKMLTAAHAFETRVAIDTPKLDASSVATMKSRGLIVTELDPKALADFHVEAEKASATMRGGIVPADVYDLALQARNAFRKTKGALTAGR